MNPFESAPNEVVARILACCDDFTQLLNLITTCKRLHSVWIANPGAIIWDVGCRNLICFDDALMAIRATNIVKTSHEAGVRPPDPFPISELSGTVQKPNPQELKEVFGVQHLARCIKYTIFNWETPKTSDLDFSSISVDRMTSDGDSFMEEEEGSSSWHDNLYRAIYRFVLLGASCSGPFNEPLFAAAEDNAPIGQSLVAMGQHYEKFSRTTLQYLQRFPAYSSNATKYEDVFKPFANWLVANGKERHEDDHEATAREILHLLAIYYHFQEKTVNGDCHKSPGRYLGRHDMNNEGAMWHQAIEHRCTTGRNPRPPPSPSGFPGGIRTTNVVFFGVFQVEEISLPVCLEDLTERYLFANPSHNSLAVLTTNTSKDKISPTAFWDIPSFLPRDDLNAPPAAIFHFFSFTLRKYFNFRFNDMAFAENPDPGSERAMPFESLAWPVLFCDGVWGEGLVDKIEDA